MSDINAEYAVLCSYLGLTARDLGEIGEFSERFARDLLAGRRPFPRDVQDKLFELRKYLDTLSQAMYEEVVADGPTIYIYRSNQQLRDSIFGQRWPEAAFLGPYRVAALRVLERRVNEGHRVNLVFASTPADEELNSP